MATDAVGISTNFASLKSLPSMERSDFFIDSLAMPNEVRSNFIRGLYQMTKAKTHLAVRFNKGIKIWQGYVEYGYIYLLPVLEASFCALQSPSNHDLASC